MIVTPMMSIEQRPFEVRPEILKLCINDGLVKIYETMGVNLDAAKQLIGEKSETLAQKILFKISEMRLNRPDGINICLGLSTLDKCYKHQFMVGLKKGPQLVFWVDVTREILKSSSVVPKIKVLKLK